MHYSHQSQDDGAGSGGSERGTDAEWYIDNILNTTPAF